MPETIELRKYARTPYQRVLIHQLLFGKAIPAKNLRGKFSWSLTQPRYSEKVFRNGKTYYNYDGKLMRWENGKRVPLPGVEVGRGIIKLSEEMAKETRLILKDIIGRGG